jgi:hypothetical protein
VLLFSQTIFLGIAAFPLYGLAKIFLKERQALFIALVYLFYPSLGYINLYEFHPPSLAVFFLSMALYNFFKKSFFYCLVWSFLSMFCQENIALGIIMMGVYALFSRRPFKWAFALLLTGGLYFFIAIAVIMPRFNPKTIQFGLLYSQWGNSLPTAVMGMLANPLTVIKRFIRPESLTYYLQVFGPLGFLPFFSLSLIMSLLFFCQHILSARPAETTIYYHYTAESIPFIFTALIIGIKNLKKWSKAAVWFMIAASVIGCFFLSPAVKGFFSYKLWARPDEHKRFERLVATVPGNASVAATFRFLPHLTGRRYLYSFHHIYSGHYTLSSKQYPLPKDIAYALIDFEDQAVFNHYFPASARYYNFRSMLEKCDLSPALIQDSLVLFERQPARRLELYRVNLTEEKPSQEKFFALTPGLDLKGYDLIQYKDGLNIQLYFKCVQQQKYDAEIFFQFISKEDKSVIKTVHMPLGYALYPPSLWKPGECIINNFFLAYPENFRDNNSILIRAIIVFDAYAKEQAFFVLIPISKMKYE